MDEIVQAIKMISDESLKNDKAILDLVNALISKVMTLEAQVKMLMELHIIPSDDENYKES